MRALICHRAMCGVLVMVSAMLVRPAAAQISPGELSGAHAEIDGVRNCLKCHELGKGPSAEKCLACHLEIARPLTRQAGYHHQVVNVEKRACFECHNEHAGRNFQLVHWPDGMKRFPHKKTGFDLVGKHAAAGCRDCHKSNKVGAAFKKLHKNVNLARTFLGLGSACLDCHHDEHRGQMKADCITCHSHEGWKPAPGFDHGKTRFALTGRHRQVACGKCHRTVDAPAPDNRDDTSYLAYTGLESGDCASCHKDIHKGKLPGSCASCHRTSGWSDINTARFDHSRTGFALTGRHTQLQCGKCHGEGSKLKKQRAEQCGDCHKDPHRAQFAAHKTGGKCEACHRVEGFQPSTFTIADHRDGRFPLHGAHLAQPCSACHKHVEDGDGRFQQFKMANVGCAACHADEHRGQFQSSGGEDCRLCHTSGSFVPSTFTVTRHRETRFPLVGTHARVPCAGCHQQVDDHRGSYAVYRLKAFGCETCHETTTRIARE